MKAGIMPKKKFPSSFLLQAGDDNQPPIPAHQHTHQLEQDEIQAFSAMQTLQKSFNSYGCCFAPTLNVQIETNPTA
jgi:hypothetical protein